MKKRKPSALNQALEFAGSRRYLSYLSWVLSGVSAILSILPFVELFLILSEVMKVAPNFAQATGIVRRGWLAVLFALLSMLIYFAGLMCAHLSAFRAAGNMKRALLQHIAKLPVGFADEIGSGRLRRVVLDSTADTETMLAHNLPDMVQAIVTPICMIAMLFIYDWRFGIACILPMLIGFCMMFQMAGPAMKEDMKQYQNALEDMSNEAVEYVRGIPVVKTFGQTVFSFHRFQESIDRYSKFCIRYTQRCRKSMLLYTLFIHSAFAFLIALGLWLVKGAGAAQDILLHFLFYAMLTPVIATTMNRVMFMSENNMRLSDAIARVNEILDMEPLPEPQLPRKPQDSSVALSDVTYRYSQGAKDAVSHITMNVEPHQIVALVGPSGSGKTTVAGLLSRFFDPIEGSVEIGGVDVRHIDQAERMNTISYVFQDSSLLKRSIAENLRVAKPDASDAELNAALHAAQCDDIIERLPQGIHTVLGSEGTYLSGGEQQRIAIARAMLKGAPVVLLDEATAFADPENEALVQKAFRELAKSSTVIMIAHRLSSVRGADRIYVLDQGKIVQEGTHDSLVAQEGLYRSMWEEYQKAIRWKVGDAA
ncbi:MAG: ABC transporter ATP-binding protein [Clostridia bacterium]|nr:ABC transporter ATP-binding protein [Clostridia bacterium]